jgi:uncharacterized protein (DUF924 family)
LQILGFQAIFKSSFNTISFRQMSSITAIDPEINRTLSYWFDGDDAMKKWFRGGPKVDEEIRDQFGDLVEKARGSKLTSWTEQPQGTLALLLLLDQFPRNIFRGTPASFSSDSMARDIAVNAIAKGQHREVATMQETFFHLPLSHDERLISQIATVALFESMLLRCQANSEDTKFAEASLGAGKSHLEVIRRFGRFPGRNAVLDRESTPEELEFLKEHPFGL